jgi:hypothetical protein
MDLPLNSPEQHRAWDGSLLMISTSDILNATILIVDDLQANVRLLENMLRGAGHIRGST